MLGALAAGAIAAPIVGGFMQQQTSREAAAASAAEQRKVEEALNKVQNPNFDMSQFTPEEYQLVGKYKPEMLPLVQERAPQLVQQSATGQQGTDAMMSALYKLRDVGNSGADAQSKALNEQALQQSQIQNQGQQASIMDSMARRGAAPGSGMEFAAALNAQQGNNQAASQAGTQAALSGYQNRLQALKDSAGIGNQISAQDTAMQTSNAGIINGFNQRMASMQNQNNQYNTGNLNDAQRLNLAAQQNTADQNVGLRNNAVADKNSLAQTQYQNALDKVRIQQGISASGSQNALTSARDQNNATQGMTSGISSGLMYAGSKYGNDDTSNTKKTG